MITAQELRDAGYFYTCTVDNLANQAVCLVTSEDYAAKFIWNLDRAGVDKVAAIVTKGSFFDTTLKFAKEKWSGELNIYASWEPEIDFIKIHNIFYPCKVIPRVSIDPAAEVHETVILGADAMRYVKIEGKPVRMNHIGGVVIDEGARIDANTVIHRGSIDNTYIGKNVLIGSNCNIGHNSRIEADVVITPGVIVGGSAIIRKGCYIGMGAVIRNGVEIDKQSFVGMGSVVTGNLMAGGKYFGNPAKYKGGWNGEWKT